MSKFSSLPQIENALNAAKQAKTELLADYPLEKNEWVAVPPDGVLRVLRSLESTIGQLENLCEWGGEKLDGTY